MPRKTIIPRPVKRYIVESFACFQTPSEIVEAVKDRYGLELGRQAVAHYDPLHSADVAMEWRLHFESTRKAFREEVSRLALAHQPFRLQEIEKIYRKAAAMKNYPLALQALEQAAKEMGGAYLRSVAKEGGGNEESVPVGELTPEQAAAMLSQRLGADAGKVLPYPQRKRA